MIDDLGSRAEQLRTEVAGLRADVQSLRDRTVRGEKRLVHLALAVVLVLLLAGATAVTAYRGLATDRRLDAFCPVLALVVGGYDPSTRPAGPARDKYEASFAVMRQAYAELGCDRSSPLVPPRTTP